MILYCFSANNHNRKKNAKNSGGFTLLEVIMAIFVLSLSAFGSFYLIQSTVISTSLNKQKLTAYYLAQESLEVVRNIRDNNWLKQRTDKDLAWDNGLTGDCMTPRISPCDSYGDTNFDGLVTEEDVASTLFQSCFNQAAEGLCVRCDLDGSGHIDISDFGMIADYVNNCGTISFPICGTKAEFQKEITVTKLSEDLIEVSATISWEEKERSHEVEVISQLSNWR